MEVGEWTRLECKGELLPARWLHSCILWGDELVIFGGKGDSYMGDLWSLDLKTQIWKQLKPKGHPPTPRYGHSAILWNSGMILFGGYDGGRWLSDTFHLDLRSLEWSEKVPTGEVPKGRDEHSAVLWGDAMLMFGGTGGGGGKFLNDTWTWNLRSGLWQQLVPKGDMPAGRCAHSAVLCNDRMAVFGGLGSALTVVLNDVWMFSLETHRWERFNCEGHVPEGRCRHCAVMCDDHMVVFGGAGRKNHFDTCSLHLRTGAWTLHQDKADHPPGHRLHTAVLWKDNLVTFGGVDASGNGQHSTWSREFIATSAEAMFATAVTPPSPTSSLRHCGSSLGREALPPTPRQDTEILAAMRGVDLAEVLEACAAMAALPENAGVQKWGCIKLTHCTDHETLAADALQLVVAALRTHWTNPQVQDWASRALATLCSGMDRASCARKEEAVAEGALEALVKSARSKEVTVKRSAIGALGTLCCGEDVGRPQRVMRALEAQALEILQQTLKTDDSSRTIRKVFAALAQLMEAAPEEVSSGETLELVEKAMAVRHDNLEIQQVGRHIQQVAVPRDCAKEKPSYWSGRATDASGWSVCPVTDATTLNALRKMFLVDHPEDLGKGRDADKYSWEYDNLQIHYAWRVEHEDCWDLYAIERAKTQKMLRRLRQQGVPISPWQSKLQDPSKELPGAIYLHEAGERFLLHGCSPEVVLKILHNGFDDKVTKKGMFGAGCYFAEDAEKVDQYARPDAGPSGPGHAELAELHARLYREGRTHPGEDVFYAFVARVVCGACLHTDGLDRNRPPRDAASGQEIFVEKYRRPVNSDMKQLVEIPGTTPPERYQTLVVNVAKGPVPGVSSRSVLRNREFVSFNRVAIYPEYVLAFLRKLT